jgi:hypothetical protein
MFLLVLMSTWQCLAIQENRGARKGRMFFPVMTCAVVRIDE